MQHRRTTNSGGTTSVLIRERCPSRDDQSHDADWPGDFLTLGLGGHTVRLNAGARGIAPLYLACDGDTLYGSWDLPDLRDQADREPGGP